MGIVVDPIRRALPSTNGLLPIRRSGVQLSRPAISSMRAVAPPIGQQEPGRQTSSTTVAGWAIWHGSASLALTQRRPIGSPARPCGLTTNISQPWSPRSPACR